MSVSGPFQHAVLVPVGFTNPKHISGGLECGQPGIFIRRIVDNQHQIDDRFRCEPRDGGRARVFDTDRAGAEQ